MALSGNTINRNKCNFVPGAYMEIDFSPMTDQQLQHFAFAIAQVALLAGFVGGFLWSLVRDLFSAVLSIVDQRVAKRDRIANARWRSHWARALREARESGYTGRRAVAYAVNAMKTRREAIAALSFDF